VDPEQIKRMVEELQRLNETVEKGFQKLSQLGGQLTGDATDVIDDIKREATDALDELGDDIVDASRSWGEAIEDSMRASLRKLRPDVTSFFGQYREEAKKTFDDFDRRALRGADKAGGMFEGLRTLNATIFSGLPFGGILGVMLFGRLQEAEYFAKAQQAGQVMQNAGRVGRQVINQLNGDIRTLEQSIPGITGNFQAAGAALANMGFTGRDAGQAISQDLSMARDTVMNLTVAMDRFFELGQGEAMKLAATVASNTNSSLKQSAELVRDIGLSVQDTGLSFNQMLGSVMQVTSALRLQTNELKEAKDVAEVIRDAQAGFQMEGFSAQGAAQAAAAGLQGVAGALQGLDTGMKAYLGSQMTGEGPSLSTFRRFEEGFRGENRSFFKDSIEALLTTSREMGGGDEDRQYLALRTAFNLSAEQAQTLMAIQQDAGEQKSISQSAEQHMDALNKAFKDEALKQSTFKTLTNRLIQVVARVGSALIDVLVSGLEGLLATVTYLTQYLTIGTTAREDDAYFRYLMMSSRQAQQGMDNALQVMQEVPKLLGQGGQMILGRSARTQQASREFYSAAFSGAGERRNAYQDISDSFSLFGGGGGRRRRAAAAAQMGGATGSWELEMDTPKDFKPGDKLTGKMRRVAGASAEQ
jgi:hypothetical protein